jgi:DNA modification methylase
MLTYKLINADVFAGLGQLADQSVNCVVTSPPYYGLRDYGVSGQLGLESTLEEYIEKMVGVFREVKRVLRSDGTCWVNMGDSFYNGGGEKRDGGHGFVDGGKIKLEAAKGMLLQKKCKVSGLKPKDLMGVPWRLAFALQSDGWYLRQDIIWHKPNPMPESVTDRCTKAHEYIFLLSKSQKYFYDAEAVKEKAIRAGSIPGGDYNNNKEKPPDVFGSRLNSNGIPLSSLPVPETRNLRSVWTIAPKPFKKAHFATFPLEIPVTCIKAGCPKNGVVLDPFSGSGTTGKAALTTGCNYIGIELNSEYIDMSRKRIKNLGLLFFKEV